MMKKKIVIVGGGTGGISLAAKLVKKHPDFEILLIEPASTHFYQPIFTLVGAGEYDYQKSFKPMKDCIPKGVTWVKDAVIKVLAKERFVELSKGEPINYDYLVLSPGLICDWEKIEGFSESMIGEHGICSNYSKGRVEKTWDILQELKEGNALFTFPATPIKCGGAPQKVMWLAQHYLEKKARTDKVNIHFATPGKRIFGVQKYKKTFEKLVEKRHIKTLFGYELYKIEPESKTAFFRHVDGGPDKQLSFEMIHITPPMSAPEFIKESQLGDEKGFADVHMETMQHKKYPEIYAIGDASSLPTGKTGAAIRKQIPVLIDRLEAQIFNRAPRLIYNGYTSCPVVTGYGRLVLAEFDYKGAPQESFPFDQSKERRSMYWLKKYGLPFLYWFGMMKGRG